ncbi:MAG: hypothetical protein H6600_06295 [Flavobacteriales bacterium]|nr:hypothetical protein [Flavobacteriales bacterium]
MVKYSLIFVMFFVGVVSFAQKSGKFETDTLKVYGNCDMCKERIENACDVVGVKRAIWEVETGKLTVVYSPSKISIEEIHQLCSEAGHATSKLKANPEAYDNLHHCCKYIIHDHDNDHEHEHDE